jgi:TldD protein
LDDPQLRELASKALDAAQSAGAQYADVRFTLTQSEQVSGMLYETEHVAVGVRALVNGAWGFVSGPSWTGAEVTRLGAQAAQQAAKNRWKTGPGVEFAAVPPAATGVWSTPVKRDVFSVTSEEKLDLVNEVLLHISSHQNGKGALAFSFERQEQTVATTDGTFVTQVLHTALKQSSIRVGVANGGGLDRVAEWITPCGAGFEAVTDIDWGARIDALYEDAVKKSSSQATDIGRFDVVLDGYAMAAFVAASLGEPLELDRARGFEANAAGTSYLAPPAEIVGQKQLGPTYLSVHANRSMPGGAATVGWDDEGIEPDAFELVKDGVVTDYSTTRQHVPVLSDYYRAHGYAARSHGCSGAGSAMDFPLVTTPNLVMEPARANTSFDDLVADLADGYAIIGGDWYMDQQGLTGQWSGGGAMVYRVKRGKIGAPVMGPALLIRSVEFWKNLQAVGGLHTVRTRGIAATKGQPSFGYAYSVSAPAARITNVAVTDVRRKYND